MSGGGAERQTINYLRYLDRDRFQPHLYLHYRRGEFLDQIPVDVPVTAFWDRHQPPRVNLPGRVHRMQVRDLAQILARNQISVVCSVTLLASLVAGAAVRRRPTPWVAIEMADPRLDFRHQVRRFRALKRRLLARAYRRAQRAVAVSDGVAEGMAEIYGTPQERIAVVRNFIDVSEVDRLSRQGGPSLEAGCFHVVTVGRLDLQKGQIHLLQALDDLVHRRGKHEVRVHVAGQGPLENELKAFVTERNLDRHVDFVGFLANPFALISRCQLFCLPSVYEGLPLALLEAMACRVPVLATDCPSGPREVLADGQFGRLIRPNSPGELAAAMEHAVDRYAEWVALADAARQRVEQAYSATSEMPRLQHLLDAACREFGALR